VDVTAQDVIDAAARIRGAVTETPALRSTQVDRRCGAEVFFKCENLQRGGAFKLRGATNTVRQLNAEQLARGVVAFSSGNHAQAVAIAAAAAGSRAVIVMPRDAPAVKLAATRDYGAEIIIYDRASEDREAIGRRLSDEHGLFLIPPYDHPHIVAGQGTAALELFRQVADLDYLLVPCGGGGILSGCALAATALAPNCKVIGVEPAAGDDATRSFKSRVLQRVENPDTIADGARTPALGQVTFPLVMRHVFDMLVVSDAELYAAMLYLWQRMKLVVEPTGALGFAALFHAKLHAPGARIGVLLSGGNVDFAAFGLPATWGDAPLGHSA